MAEFDPQSSTQPTEPVTLRVVAYLLVDPSEITPTGELAVEVLRRIGATAVDVQTVEPDTPAEQQPSHVLDVPVASALTAHGMESKTVTRIDNALARSGVVSLRDLLVVGRDYVLDTWNLGQKTVGVFEAVLADRLGPEITWHARPSIDDIAQVCPTLQEVNSVVVYSTSRLSIQEMLDTPEEDRPRAYKRERATQEPWRLSDIKISEGDIEAAQSTYARAVAFAEEFRAARQRLEQA